ncbi:adhesion G-protein coupled receptor D1-like [Physella acuta]|uniref:adhesion G-protein coupled receptor D1-like n=1 Tax=Physella acuta TaxID=109671 RepID=UPI0027DDB44C|nr:adhesion G-protein coupled receptor D1-like [Physella acuta]XP_059152996.1 adhesion G-protein coupled receptor D1-like [Physella acuta]
MTSPTLSSDIVQCITTSQCMISSSNMTSLSHEQEVDMMTSSAFLLDEMSNFVSTRSHMNLTNLLTNFAQIIDVTLQVCIVNSSACTQQQTLRMISRAERFLDGVMKVKGADIQQDFSLTLDNIDIFVTQSVYGEVAGRKLVLKTGTVSIEDISVEDGTNTSAPAVVSAVILNLPRTSVWLSRDGGELEEASLVSRVLSLSACVDQTKASISHNFSLMASADNFQRLEPVCGFQTDNKSRDIWDTFGCRLLNHTGDAVQTTGCHVVPDGNNCSQPSHAVDCQCNHTTNFAILMQIVDFQLSVSDELVLSIITYIGCGVTLVTQVMAITVFTCIRSLNSERVCVHRNLCISIMAAQLTFICGIKAVSNKLQCAIVALCLHYFYTASFVWMLVEGIHLYNQVVTVFGTERSRTVYYIVFGWGVPVILVAISAAVDWEGYGTAYSCWLSVQRSTIWAFVSPAIAVIIVNLVILVLVLRIVVNSSTKHEDLNHIKAGIKASLFLTPLLGLTWTFGIVAVNKQLVAFQYIFAILNSLQGFFIFFFHCALNSEVRQSIKRLRKRRALLNEEFRSSVSTQGRPSVSTQGRPSSGDSRSSDMTPVTFVQNLVKKHNKVGSSLKDC